MPLIQVIITLIVVGVLLWAANTYIPMAERVKQLLNIVVLIVLVWWLLSVFGLIDYVSAIRVPHR